MLFLSIIIWLTACAWMDLRWRRLPNFLTLGAYLPAIVGLIVFQQTFLGASVSSAVLAWSLAIVLTAPAYLLRWLGAGDVKLLSAMALLGGLPFMLGSYAIAALLTVALFLLWQFLARTSPYFNLQLARYGWSIPVLLPMQGKNLPFGTALGTGGVIFLFMMHIG